MAEYLRQIAELPGDLYGIKTTYFSNFASISATDIGSAVVVIGKAGERLAKGILRDCRARFDESASFDVLLKQLAVAAPNASITVGLRTVLKYRNQAAHDSGTTLSRYELDAALSAFCSAYQAAYRNPGGNSQPATAESGLSSATNRASWRPLLGKAALPVTLTAVALLVWAILIGGSYEFFMILRVIVTLNAVMLSLTAFRRNIVLFSTLIAIAALFNPLVPVYLSRGIWRWIDFLTAILFSAVGYRLLKDYLHARNSSNVSP